MISFIIIGKNEGWKLSLCLDKVYGTIKVNELKLYEVIYVDSKSTDDSLERINKYPNVKIIQLTGDCNAAIARNAGAEESNGDVLLFLDGDMELIPKNFNNFYTEENGLEYPYLSGDFDNYFYNQKWEFLSKDKGMMLDKDIYTISAGGLFLIERRLWLNLQGMNPEFVTGEDVELAIRASKKSIKLLRKKEMLVHHHMIPYFDSKRKWKMLFNKATLYGGPMLYRKHFFNKYCLKRLLRNDYTLVILFFSLLLFFVFGFYGILFYLLVITARSFKKGKSIIENTIYYITRDFINLPGFFFFYPKKPNASYKTA